MAGRQLTDPALWDEFHHLVNMTSRELADWLRASAAGPAAEALPDQAGPPVGQQVLHVLGKRRTDVTADDERLMRKVVDRIRTNRGTDLETKAGDQHWRHRLMSMGHDPLKPID